MNKVTQQVKHITVTLEKAGVERSMAVIAMSITALAMVLTLTAHTKHSFRVFADNKRVVTLSIDGKRRSVVSSSATVGGILEENSIKMEAGDVVEPATDTAVDQPNYNINVYKATPAVVVDQGKFIQVVTGYRSARKIAAAAGVTLYPEDTADLSQVQDFQSARTVGYKVTIDRALPVQLIVNGQVVNVRTHETTVGALLKEKGIGYEPKDLQGAAPETLLSNGLRVVLAKISQEPQTVIEDITPGIQTVLDANLTAGVIQNKRDGVPGKQQVTYLINRTNGQETGRSVLEQRVITPAIDRIEVRGTKTVNNGTSGDAVTIGQQLAAQRGWTGAQWDALYLLWMRESGWNPNSFNSSSGACGIPQALPCSKITDKSIHGQVTWGLNYVQGRYGNPVAAYSHWRSYGWY